MKTLIYVVVLDSLAGRVMHVADEAPDRDQMLRLVERLAILLADAGMARMPARVFAYALLDDADRYSTSELAEALRVSPAAISAALRDLVQAGLLDRHREPGERTDTYVLRDGDFWTEIFLKREGLLQSFERLAAEGIALLGRDRPGGRRMAETQDFFAFLRTEFPSLITRWRAHRREMAGR